MQLRIGDMAYVPSETYVLKKCGNTQEYEKLKKPKSLLIIGEDSRFYEVLMLGSSWLVKKRDVYGTVKEARSGC